MCLKMQWTDQYEACSKRDLYWEQFVSIWVHRIHTNVRLEDEANSKQCLLVLMGATADGQKHLIAVTDGYRESKQSWMELLLDLKHQGKRHPAAYAAGPRGPANRRPDRGRHPLASRPSAGRPPAAPGHLPAGSGGPSSRSARRIALAVSRSCRSSWRYTRIASGWFLAQTSGARDS